MTIKIGKQNLITDVPGLKVGNAVDEAARTGVTVIVPDGRVVAGVDTRGGGPGTRETDALDPTCLVDEVDGLFLSGGSVYGLDAGAGMVRWMAQKGRGFSLGGSPVKSPVVPGAILFDLVNGGDKSWTAEMPPYRELAYQACDAADASFSLGNEGAGLGAMAGSLKGGLGSASFETEDGFVVGALVAANPMGSVVMPNSRAFWAWPYEQQGEFGGARPTGNETAAGFPDDTKLGAGIEAGLAAMQAAAQPGGNTTIAVVATNATLTPAQAKRLAIMAQDGLSRAIRPVHTPVDGDTVFALATGERALAQGMEPIQLARLGNLAADCLARAVARGVYEAKPLGDFQSYQSSYV